MKDINELLDKYFDAESSIEEEIFLRKYFARNDIKEEHRKYTPIFEYINKEKQAITPKNKNRKKLTLWLSIASCAAIMIGVLVFPFEGQIKANQSVVYIDGQVITDINIISNEALVSLMSIEEEDNNIMESQIDILDSFIE